MMRVVVYDQEQHAALREFTEEIDGEKRPRRQKWVEKGSFRFLPYASTSTRIFDETSGPA
jgi:hypothetical protein